MALLALCASTSLPAQLPIVEGTSATSSGMLYYDYQVATDQRDRVYIYHICPDSAACISLDFNLVEDGDWTGEGTPEDFIEVYDGADIGAPLLGKLGARSRSRILQGQSPCLTVVFKRIDLSRRSIWTALWRAQSAAACISPLVKGPCADVQDICGPGYHENFIYYGVAGPQALETMPGTCVERPHNATWYRFMAQKDGLLNFEIVPDNGQDDFDWVLLRGDAKDPTACPDLAQAERKLACNYAVGAGPRGATGMDERGDAVAAGATESPYSAGVQARKGDVFYLLIDDFSRHSSGFRIAFNDVVMTCANPRKDVLHVDQSARLGAPPIDPRRAFTQSTRVLRIDLGEKANAALATAQLPADLFADRIAAPQASAQKSLGSIPKLAQYQGIAQFLLQGLKHGALPAYSAADFRTPLHYGDLLNLMSREQADSNKAAFKSWWNREAAAFDPYTQVLELIVDERFDKNTGTSTQQIRYLRLLWTDRDLQLPDYNVAVFRYEDLRPLLDKVPCGSRHNDVGGLSLRDALEGRQYEGVTVMRAGKGVKARFEGDRQVELGDYYWGE